jgi:pyruvate/2-oxoglutarate dehydrogenase complex dihydrolipoamide dehydrogenase (E3) component
MKEYDLISIGTGSAMHVVDAMLQRNPNLKVAVIDKDEEFASHEDAYHQRFFSTLQRW